ncbi:hypothetical protein NEOC65_000347 [Neochlamydia sp. AcF65]|nr:hypothetical protein [Neochlamydia sp. AcF65]
MFLRRESAWKKVNFFGYADLISLKDIIYSKDFKKT